MCGNAGLQGTVLPEFVGLPTSTTNLKASDFKRIRSHCSIFVRSALFRGFAERTINRTELSLSQPVWAVQSGDSDSRTFSISRIQGMQLAGNIGKALPVLLNRA